MCTSRQFQMLLLSAVRSTDRHTSHTQHQGWKWKLARQLSITCHSSTLMDIKRCMLITYTSAIYLAIAMIFHTAAHRFYGWINCNFKIKLWKIKFSFFTHSSILFILCRVLPFLLSFFPPRLVLDCEFNYFLWYTGRLHFFGEMKFIPAVRRYSQNT